MKAVVKVKSVNPLKHVIRRVHGNQCLVSSEQRLRYSLCCGMLQISKVLSHPGACVILTGTHISGGQKLLLLLCHEKLSGLPRTELNLKLSPSDS